MSNKYVIFMDVSGDIDADFAKANNVLFVPMDYTLGQEDRKCTEIEQEDILVRFYNGQREGDLTQTSQINPQSYREIFEPYVKQGISVLYITLSSGLSGTYQSSRLTAAELAEEYPGAEVQPVDSLAGTAGMGLLVEMAVKNKKDGMTVSENADWLRGHAKEVCHWFSVEDLMYLKRGGRISAATAIVGTTLNIKPILKIDNNGKLINFDKKRGNKGSMKALVEYYMKSVDMTISNRVYIIHGDSQERAESLKQLIIEKTPEADIKIMMLSPIIGAHTGPGMLAVIHWGKER